MNIMVNKTFMLTCIFILIYLHNNTLPQIIKTNSSFIRKLIEKHMVELKFKSGSSWKFNYRMHGSNKKIFNEMT